MNWTNACLTSYNRLPDDNLAVLYSSGGITIAAYFLSAVAGGIMFTRWLRIDAEEKANLWPLYGWLSGLICFASCAGIVYISALIATLEGVYKNIRRDNAFPAVASIFLVGVRSTYFLMLAVDRIKDFATLAAQPESVTFKLLTSFRWIVCVIAAGLLLEFCAVLSEVGFSFQLRNLFEKEKDTDPSNSPAQKNLFHSIRGMQRLQHSTEICVLCICIITLLILCIFCIIMIRSSIGKLPNSASQSIAGRLVGLRIIGTTVVGIASFLLQLVYTILLLQSQGSDSEICELCSPPCSLECSFGCSIYWWIVYSPEFSIIIHLLSTALTMLLILWSLTSERLLQAMREKKGPRHQHNNMRVLLHQ